MRHTSTILPTLIAIILLSYSCDKNDPVTPHNPAFKGDFVSDIHATSGVATINQEETILTLTDFKTDSGPDLNIYLASSIANITADFIDLGNIKGLDGDYTYTLPENNDYRVYKYVVVWCVDFNVNFGFAELEEQG